MTELRRRLGESRVVAIVRSPVLTVDTAVRVVEILRDTGTDVVEFTLNSRDALDAIEATAARFADDVAVGAGTVLTADQVRQVVDRGGSFVVAPDTSDEVLGAAADAGVAALPGAHSATEVRRAWDRGASLVKLFPSGPGGLAHLKALRGPFPHIPLVPTGGVGLGDIAPLLDAGAVAVGLGSVLVSAADPTAGLADRAMVVRRSVEAAA